MGNKCAQRNKVFPHGRGEQFKNRKDVSFSTSLFCLHVININCVKCVPSVSYKHHSELSANIHILLSGCPSSCIIKMDVSGMIQKMLFTICRLYMQPTHLTMTLKCSPKSLWNFAIFFLLNTIVLVMESRVYTYQK